LALLAMALSGPALADSIDINLNSDSIQAEYASYWRTADFTLGLLSNRDTKDWVASAGLLARGAKQTAGSRTEVGLGGKVYVVSVGHDDIEALGLGGAVRVFPGNGPIGIGGYAFYAPDIVTGGDGKRFWETGVHLDFEVIRDTADIYIGYRKLRAELNDGSHVTADKGGYVGVRISF
jgi:YfaZ precursor